MTIYLGSHLNQALGTVIKKIYYYKINKFLLCLKSKIKYRQLKSLNSNNSSMISMTYWKIRFSASFFSHVLNIFIHVIQIFNLNCKSVFNS